MEDKFTSFISRSIGKFPTIYIGGLSLHDKSHIKKLEKQAVEIGVDIQFKFSSKEREEKRRQLQGNILFNYDVQAELMLVHEKCLEHGLQLYLYHEAGNLNGIVYLFIQKTGAYPSFETNNVICCTLNESDKDITSAIFINGLAYQMIQQQRNVFSGFYSMDNDEVDKKVITHELTDGDFVQNLSSREK